MDDFIFLQHRDLYCPPFGLLAPTGVALWLITVHGVTTWYFALPAWIACAALYLLFRQWTARAAART